MRVGLGGDGAFAWLWLGQTASLLGSQVSYLGLPLVAATTLHASPLQMGALEAAGQLPQLLVGLPAGALVDRVRRRPLLIGADLARALLLAAVPVALLLGLLGVGLLCVLAALLGAAGLLFDVAYEAYLPGVVGEARLTAANARLEMSQSAAEVGGQALAGGLVQLLTAPVALLADAGSFVASALTVWSVRTPEPARVAARRRGSPRHELAAGARFLLADPLLRAPVASAAVAACAAQMPLTVYWLFLTRELRVPPAAIGAVFSLAGCAGLAGAAVSGRAARRLGLRRTLLAGQLAKAAGAACVTLAARPLALGLPLLLAGEALFALGIPLFGVNARSLRQRRTPDRLRGRVGAAANLLIWGPLPLAALAGGLLGARIGLRPTLAVGAVGMLLAAGCLLAAPAGDAGHPHPEGA